MMLRQLAVMSYLLVSFPGLAQTPNCSPAPADNDPRAVREGYLDFITPAKLAPFKLALPTVADARVQGVLKSPDTIWYDEESMVFLYQDSVEVVVGGRANCVGRSVGERNRNNPDIARLMNYFGADYKFKYPFRKAAGTDNVENVKVFNFWSPPKTGGKVMPVKWWKESSRGRWHWVFPVGTVFGEVLFQQGPDSNWYVFEIRTRTRYLDGWTPALFRPFGSAAAMAQEIAVRRPDWQQSANLSAVMAHLQNKNTLVGYRLESQAFGKIFPPITGALDPVPDIEDKRLVVELLTGTPFTSMEGSIWKENATHETYAPASQGSFSIVPKGYEMGMIPVNEVSCNRCHVETGHSIGDFEYQVMLYGEVWGEDRIFTWHLFQPNSHIYDTWDDTDTSRVVNPRLIQAGLLKQEMPTSSDPNYRQLPIPYKPIR